MRLASVLLVASSVQAFILPKFFRTSPRILFSVEGDSSVSKSRSPDDDSAAFFADKITYPSIDSAATDAPSTPVGDSLDLDEKQMVDNLQDSDSSINEADAEIREAQPSVQDVSDPVTMPEPTKPIISDEMKEKMKATKEALTATITQELIEPLVGGDFEKGISSDVIKGAAIAGAALPFLAGQDVTEVETIVMSASSAIIAAYLAIIPKGPGVVTRKVGDFVWKITSSAKVIYDKIESNNEFAAATRTFLAGTLDAVVRSIPKSEGLRVDGEKSDTGVEEVSDGVVKTPEQEKTNVEETELGVVDGQVDEDVTGSDPQVLQEQMNVDAFTRGLVNTPAFVATDSIEDMVDPTIDDNVAVEEGKVTEADLQALLEEEEEQASLAEEAAMRAIEEAEKAAEALEKEEEELEGELEFAEETVLGGKTDSIDEEILLDPAPAVTDLVEEVVDTDIGSTTSIDESEISEAELQALLEEEASLAEEAAMRAVEEAEKAAKALAEEEERLTIAQQAQQKVLEERSMEDPEVVEEVAYTDEAQVEGTIETVGGESFPDDEEDQDEESFEASDEVVFDEKEWEESIRLARELDGEDVEVSIFDQEEKDQWEKAGKLAQELASIEENDAYEDYDDDEPELSPEELEAQALAAREAVEKFEMEQQEKKNEVIERRQQWNAEMYLAGESEPLEFDDLDNNENLEELAAAARAAVEKFESEDGGDFDVGDALEMELDSFEFPSEQQLEIEPDSVEATVDAKLDEELGSLETDSEIFLDAQNAATALSVDEDSEEDDAEIDFDDLEALGAAARAAVEALESGGEAANESESDFAESLGDFVESSSSSLELGAEEEPSVVTDWNSLKVVDLKAELKARGLRAVGKKAALVAALEESDRELSGSEVDSVGDAVESSGEVIDFDDLEEPSMEELAQMAREAAELFNSNLQNEEEDIDDLFDALEEDDQLPSQPETVEIDSSDITPEFAATDDAGIGVDEDYKLMTVSQLKEELRARGLKVSGKKADLIARLESS